MEVLLHLQLLVPERGPEAQQPVIRLTARRAHLRIHVQRAGVTAGSVGLGARKEESKDSADTETLLLKDLTNAGH